MLHCKGIACMGLQKSSPKSSWAALHRLQVVLCWGCVLIGSLPCVSLGSPTSWNWQPQMLWWTVCFEVLTSKLVQTAYNSVRIWQVYPLFLTWKPELWLSIRFTKEIHKNFFFTWIFYFYFFPLIIPLLLNDNFFFFIYFLIYFLLKYSWITMC